MSQTAHAAWWFLPFVLPLCLYVAYTDLARMKITNKAVMALVAVYVLIGPIALPTWDIYLWGFACMIVVLLAGMVLNAIGAMGAGDAKFLAAAAPFIAPGDIGLLISLLTGVTLAAFATHRLVRATSLRSLAPDWTSWDQGNRFPMGLSLGPTLALYLCLAALKGA
jgi:prepilin peptidase CpaA